jgi:hypothetical protein
MFTIQTPTQALSISHRNLPVSRLKITRFKQALVDLAENGDPAETEENFKLRMRDFLKKAVYGEENYINTKGRYDLVIHLGPKSKDPIGVLIEAKRPDNKAEMPTDDSPDAKAMQELLLYYLRERITHQNVELRRLIVTDTDTWYIFDAAEFETRFAADKKLVKAFQEFEAGELVGKKTEFFYEQIARPALQNPEKPLTPLRFRLSDYLELARAPELDAPRLLDLYKVFTPEYLLKKPLTNDSNTLNEGFYFELLHLMGLEEIDDDGRKLIVRKQPAHRHPGSLLENAIAQLKQREILDKLPDAAEYGTTEDECLFNAGLELTITWINRILFLKLLEGRIVAWNRKEDGSPATDGFLNIQRTPGYPELNDLFFRVLAIKTHERDPDMLEAYPEAPYLNSALFEKTDLEKNGLLISDLKARVQLPLFSNTVLKDRKGNRKEGKLSALDYLFEFLNAYDFAADTHEPVREEPKTIINAAVLGLIFEKINGYADGSFFTPGYITMYMCRETLRRAVLQKFNRAKGWNCQTLAELSEKIEDRAEANQIVNSLRICDPAVGSGHFLVSALNELIAIKAELKILLFREGGRIRDYRFEIENDELVIYNDSDVLYHYRKGYGETQQVQEAIFHEKRTLIEQCLFGVDINPNSVRICQLRLWIELLKFAYYTRESELREMQTLPNIDINIRTGNSLLSRFPVQGTLRFRLDSDRRRVEELIERFKWKVEVYKNEQLVSLKREIRKEVAQIKEELSLILLRDDKDYALLQKREAELAGQPFLFSASDREAWEERTRFLSHEVDRLKKQLAETAEKFRRGFEWRYEFPEVLDALGNYIGFDVVVGNPPYIRQERLSHLKPYLSEHYEVYAGTADIYAYFYEKSAQIATPGGYVSLITANKFMRANYGKPLRTFLRKRALRRIVDFCELKVFASASTFPAIYFFQEIAEPVPTYFTQIKSLEFKTENLETKVRLGEVRLPDTAFDPEGWSLSVEEVQRLLDKIKSKGIPLGNYVDGQIYRGVVTGLNEAFIITAAKRAELIAQDPSCERYIKPVAVGNDIRKYSYPHNGRYIIVAKQKSDIHTNTVLINHLATFKDQLVPKPIGHQGKWNGRAPGKYQWYEWQTPVAYLDKFSGPKIVYPDIAKESRATYFDNELYFTNTVYFIPQKDYYLLGLLNSRLIWYYFKSICAVLGDPEKGGRLRWFTQDVIKIPIVELVSPHQRNLIEDLVSEILSCKAAEPAADTSELEAEIDRLVYCLYGLTDEEIRLVEGG